MSMDKGTFLAILIGCVLGYMAQLIFMNFAFILKVWLCWLCLKWLFAQYGRDSENENC